MPAPGPADPSRALLVELSHSLQTPLAVLKGRVARLRVGKVHEGSQPDLDGIDACVDALSRIIAETLCLNSMSLQEQLCLSELVEESVQDVTIISEHCSISVFSSIEPGITLYGNNHCLRDTVANLLANAVKYMGNGARKEIHIKLQRIGSAAVLEIADTGIGIPEADLPHIFNRFYRGTRVYGVAPGQGLGLALVKRTVEAHSGKVAVASIPDVGTTFTLTFPLLRHQDAREGIGGDDDMVDQVDTEEASSFGDLPRDGDIRSARRRAS